MASVNSAVHRSERQPGGGAGGSGGVGGGADGSGDGSSGGDDGQATTTPPDVQAVPLQYFHEPVSSGHCAWSLAYKPPELVLMSGPTSQTESMKKR
jgi:hypothetical protein